MRAFVIPPDAMPRSPQEPIEVIVRNLFAIQRAGSSLNDGVQARVQALFDEIAALIAKVDPGGPSLQRYRLQRAETLFAEIRSLTGETFDEITRQVRVQLAGLGQAQADAATLHLQAMLGTEAGGEVEAVKVTLNQMKAIVDSEPMQGALLKDWFRKQGADTAFRVQRQIQLGMTNAEGIGSLVDRVRKLVLPTSQREAEAVVRTAVNHISTAAAERSFRANADIIDRIEWVATLDASTCFPAGTRVLTPSGEQGIETLQVGDEVIGGSGRVRRVLAVQSKRHSGPMASMHAGERVLIGTADHRIGTNVGWVELGSVQPEHEVVCLEELLNTRPRGPVFDPRFFDVEDGNSELGKAPVARIVPLRVVPVGAVNLQRHISLGQEEVHAQASERSLLLKGDLVAGEHITHGGFNAGFAGKRAVTAEGTEAARAREAGLSAEGFSAVDTLDSVGRAPTLFGAEAAVALAPLEKTHTAPLAVGIGSTAGEGTPGVARCVGPGNRESLPTRRTHLFNPVLRGAEIAGARAKLLAGFRLGAAHEECRTTSFAGHGCAAHDGRGVITGSRAKSPPPSGLVSEGDTAALATLYHASNVATHAAKINVFRGCAWVYDIEVETDHCFFAEGVLVHNCATCGPLDGKTWALDDPNRPKPPLHMRDRCVLVAVPDWKGLGLEPPPSGTRATKLDPETGKPGQVSSDVHYEDWLRSQPAAVQNEILGPGRATVFRDGKVTLAQMVRTDGTRVPLESLAAQSSAPAGLVRAEAKRAHELTFKGLDPDAPGQFETKMERLVSEGRRGVRSRLVGVEGMDALADALGFDPKRHLLRGQDPAEGRAAHVASTLTQHWDFLGPKDRPWFNAMHLAARDEFGIEGAWTAHLEKGAAAKKAAEIYGKHGPALRAYVRAQYEETQAYLKANGVEHVTLFRGITGIETGTPGGSLETWAEQPLSSFSYNAQIAGRFAIGNGDGKVRRLPERSGMIAVRVPADRVFSMSRTGPGKWAEGEFVLLGGEMEGVSVDVTSQQAFLFSHAFDNANELTRWWWDLLSAGGFLAP